MRKRTAKSILLLASSSLLFSCGNSNTESSSSISSSESSYQVSSLYEAFNLLSSSKNYDIETKALYGDGSKLTYHNLFQPTYTFCDYPDYETGYASKNGEIFRFDLYHEQYVASEAYEGSDIYEEGYALSLDFDPAIFKDSQEKVMEITAKKAKLQWLSFLELDTTNLLYIESAEVELTGNDINSLTFRLEFDGAAFTSKITHFGNAGDAGIEEFLNDASPATIDESLLIAKDDFALDNYVRVIEEEVTVSSETKARIGTEYYLPNYFYTHYFASSGFGIQSSGYISLHNKKLVYEEEEVNFDGAYYFALNEDLSALSSFLATGPAFTTNVYDMPSIMNYASKLEMFDHNLQFFEVADESDYDGVTYTTDKQSILHEFFAFCQVGYLLDENYATRYLRSLSISIDEGNSDLPEDDVIVFLFSLKQDGVFYNCEYRYEQFGKANIPCVEEFASLFVDA